TTDTPRVSAASRHLVFRGRRPNFSARQRVRLSPGSQALNLARGLRRAQLLTAKDCAKDSLDRLPARFSEPGTIFNKELIDEDAWSARHYRDRAAARRLYRKGSL